ncbi:MAG: MFS transporter [Bdellovibrionaceae bacterium]|nr:MFS transporter [Pseudobdellovibrionaceae bacterium]
MNWGYIVLAYLSLFVLGLADNSRGPLFPEILKTFSVSDSEGAVFFAVGSFLGFIGSYSVRYFLPKINRVPTLQVSLVAMAVGLIGMAYAQEFYQLLIFSAVFGFSLGIVGVVQNILATVGSTPQRRQRMLSGLHSVYGMSSLMAPLVVAGIAAFGGDWRTVFLVVSAVPLALTFAAFWNRREEPLSKLKLDATESSASKGRGGDWAQMYLGLALGMYVLAEMMVSTRLSLYVRREYQMDLAESSYYLTGFFVCMLAGRLLFALVPFRWPLRWMLSASLIASALCITLGIQVSPLFFALTGFCMGPFYPLAVAYVYQHFADRIDAAISSCMAIQAFLTVLMHAGVGYLTDVYGISKALWVGPAALLLAFLILNSFERVFKKRV